MLFLLGYDGVILIVRFLDRCLYRSQVGSWIDKVECDLKKLNGKSFKKTICNLALGATIYHIWLDPNAIHFIIINFFISEIEFYSNLI